MHGRGRAEEPACSGRGCGCVAQRRTCRCVPAIALKKRKMVGRPCAPASAGLVCGRRRGLHGLRRRVRMIRATRAQLCPAAGSEELAG
eukprot:gene15211-biopygen21698